jgi:hypothetical protein
VSKGPEGGRGDILKSRSVVEAAVKPRGDDAVRGVHDVSEREKEGARDARVRGLRKGAGKLPAFKV